jgi:thiamine biosynthesis lipoprotein
MLFAASDPNQRRLDFARRGTATSAGWVVREEAIMGTAIRVELWAEERRLGELAATAVVDEMHRIDRCMSPHKPASELSRINRDAARQSVPLSDEMFRLVEQAMAFSRLSGGAFDISYAAVGRLYDYRTRVRPDAATLQAARERVGWQHLHLDPHARTLRFGLDGMCIDLGGFAKGHAVDRAAALLRAWHRATPWSAPVATAACIGDRRGRPWSVAIRHPRRAGRGGGRAAAGGRVDLHLGRLRALLRARRPAPPPPDRPGHRLLSPRSVHSVTILAADGLTSEALSKTVFVLGVERGLALVETLPGIDAVVVDAARQVPCQRFVRPDARHPDPSERAAMTRVTPPTRQERTMSDARWPAPARPGCCTHRGAALAAWPPWLPWSRARAAAPAARATRVTVNGDVPIAYVKRSTAVRINPTDGTNSAPGGDLMLREKSSRPAPPSTTSPHASRRGKVTRPTPRSATTASASSLHCAARPATPPPWTARRRREGLHRALEPVGIRHGPAGRWPRARFKRLTVQHRTRRRRPGLPAGQPRHRLQQQPAGQVAPEPGAGPQLLRRRRVRARTGAQPAHDGRRRQRHPADQLQPEPRTQPGDPPQRRHHVRALGTRGRPQPLRHLPQPSPTAPTCLCCTARTAPATATCTRATWTRGPVPGPGGELADVAVGHAGRRLAAAHRRRQLLRVQHAGQHQRAGPGRPGGGHHASRWDERGLSPNGRATTPYPLWDGTRPRAAWPGGLAKSRATARSCPASRSPPTRSRCCQTPTAPWPTRSPADAVQDNAPAAYAIYMFDPGPQTWLIVADAARRLHVHRPGGPAGPARAQCGRAHHGGRRTGRAEPGADRGAQRLRHRRPAAHGRGDAHRRRPRRLRPGHRADATHRRCRHAQPWWPTWRA